MSTSQGGARESTFFYADREAVYYDIAEELTQPCIDLIHDTMVDLVEYSLKGVDRKPLDRPVHVLDAASGTGAEAFRLMERLDKVRITAVDFSPPMNRILRGKFKEKHPDLEFAESVTLLEEDFFGEACAPSRLLDLLPGDLDPRGFDAVVAGFFLHHYPVEVKMEFYRRSFASLRPGGVLVLSEPFEFESKALSEFAHDFGDRWIEKQFRNPDERLRVRQEKLGAEAPRLCREWLEHRTKTHIYLPDASLSGRSPQDHGESVTNHAGLAIAAGFKEVGFPFRVWESGVLWALKK